MMFTSYHAKTDKLLQAGIVPVCISIFRPRFIAKEKQVHYKPLAPTPEMLKFGYTWEEFHEKILGSTKIETVLDDLAKIGKGKDVALLCFEKNDMECHRHVVRRWLNIAGVKCEEWK
jgi:uncharacterized protein YeaO (DUF488 family)